MDHSFTAKIKAWLDAAPGDRDPAEGAHMLLRLSGNRIMYANIMAAPDARAEFLEEQLRRYYDFRVLDLTRDQVAAMDAKVEEIVERHGLDRPERPSAPAKTVRKAEESAASRDDRLIGKRTDHDSLPDEIRARWTENLDLLRRMREAHLRLRTMTLGGSPCPDSERYPFVSEIIRLDKRLHDNWRVYDEFGKTPDQDADASVAKESAS